MDTLMRLRRNVSSRVRKGTFDPDQVNLEAWMMKLCRHAAIDLIRKSGKRRGEFSIDATSLGDDESSLHELLGEEDNVMNWWLDSDESAEQSGKAGELMKALEDHGGRTQKKSRHLRRHPPRGQTGRDRPIVTGVSRGAVDNLKYEMTWQLNAIITQMEGGIGMIDAVKSTPAKPPKKFKER